MGCGPSAENKALIAEGRAVYIKGTCGECVVAPAHCGIEAIDDNSSHASADLVAKCPPAVKSILADCGAKDLYEEFVAKVASNAKPGMVWGEKWDWKVVSTDIDEYKPKFSALGINLSVSMIRRTSGSPPNQQTHYTYWITYVDSKKANYTAPSQWNGEGCCIM